MAARDERSPAHVPRVSPAERRGLPEAVRRRIGGGAGRTARARRRGRERDAASDGPADDMRDEFLEMRINRRSSERRRGTSSSAPLRVGFVACSFNSKAVLYLSHDMFRFFDPTAVEVHVFSTGPPDHPRFISGTMRGVDWRRRVEDAVDRFHDVREYRSDHAGLARYIRSHGIQVLVEWDGYARQGERAAGLMALRPAPVQVLHQEFLMTSGAQYFDYIVTDRTVSPLRLEGLYTEKFLYLPHHFFSKGHRVQGELTPPSLEYVHRKPGDEFKIGVGTPQENACLASNPLGTTTPDADDYGDDGQTRGVSFVYCNFNKFLKNNPETMRSWIRILHEVPNSVLCLLENPREGVPNLRKFVDEATSRDGTPNVNDRIHFLTWERNPYDHQRRTYSLCNAMLDSHPYNGHTTAQDALYAGVPVVTRSDGDNMSSRVSTSANAVLGLEELRTSCRAAGYRAVRPSDTSPSSNPCGTARWGITTSRPCSPYGSWRARVTSPSFSATR